MTDRRNNGGQNSKYQNGLFDRSFWPAHDRQTQWRAETQNIKMAFSDRSFCVEWTDGCQSVSLSVCLSVCHVFGRDDRLHMLHCNASAVSLQRVAASAGLLLGGGRDLII